MGERKKGVWESNADKRERLGRKVERRERFSTRSSRGRESLLRKWEFVESEKIELGESGSRD